MGKLKKREGVVSVPSINLRKTVYNSLVVMGFEPTEFANTSAEIMLDICRMKGLKPEERDDKSETERILRELGEKIKNLLEEYD